MVQNLKVGNVSDKVLAFGGGARNSVCKLQQYMISGCARLRKKLACERGQGTTEYAILVGVLVVIAILAIVIFRPRLEELWNSISEGINSL